RLRVGAPVALRRTINAIGPVKAGIKPLRAVRRCDLRGQHEAMLVEKCARIRFRVEIAAFPAPIGPGACETVKDLPGVALGAKARVSGQGRERFMVRLMTPQEGRN